MANLGAASFSLGFGILSIAPLLLEKPEPGPWAPIAALYDPSHCPHLPSKVQSSRWQGKRLKRGP